MLTRQARIGMAPGERGFLRSQVEQVLAGSHAAQAA